MTSIAQDIRYAKPNPNNLNNPQSLYTSTKPSRIIITDGVPEQDEGELLWYAIDQNTGVLYKKTEESGGQWQGIYQFAGGAGSIQTAINVGLGDGWFLQKAGNILEFKSITTIPEIPTQESKLKIYNNAEELNIVTPATISFISDYQDGTTSNNWLFDPFDFEQDSNGNRIAYQKPITSGNGIQVVTIQPNPGNFAKRLQIRNTGIVTMENAEPANPGRLVLPTGVGGVSTIRNIGAGAGVTITQNPTNLRISLNPSYFYNYQLAQTYGVSSNFQNLPPFTPSLFSSDWVSFPNINGSSFFRYQGSVDTVYSLNYNIFAYITLQPSVVNFTFRIAEGDPLISQSAVPVSGAILTFPSGSGVYNSNTSQTFLFKPVVGQYYTLQASCTINQLPLTVEEIKLNVIRV